MTKAQNSNQNNTVKLQILEGNRIKLSLHPTFHSTRLEKFDYTNCTNRNPSPYMTTRNYIRDLRTFHESLWELHFDNENFYFITLTFKDYIKFRDIQKRLRTLRTALKRQYGNFEFMRVIEITKKHSYHVHMIAQFNEFPLDLSVKKINSIWKLGKCYLEPNYDLRGCIQYITKYKENSINYDYNDYLKEFKNAIQKQNKHLTYFPKNARIIAKSQNFGKKLNSDNIKELFITKEQSNKIKDYFLNKYKNNNGSFVRLDGHNYFDKNANELKYCLDKVFIRDTTFDEILKILAC